MKTSMLVFLALSFITQPLLTIAAELDAKEVAGADAAEAAAAGARAPLEEKFRAMMSGATLVGRYTQDDQADDKPPAEERYTIKKVTKVADLEDVWRFDVRIQFGKYDVTLPLNLQVLWAGDTPVITLTDYRIPALGTFSARVLMRGDRYAGTWQHGKVGGHLFGTIERDLEEDKTEGSNDAAKPPVGDASK